MISSFHLFFYLCNSKPKPFSMKNYNFKWVLFASLLMMISCGNGNTYQTETETETVVEDIQIESEDNQVVEEPTMPAYESGTVHVITADEFVELVTDIDNPKGFQYKGDMPCIVDFYADWCGPCHRLSPILQEVAEEYKGKIMIYKVNVDKSATISEAFKVNSIPTLVFFAPHSQPAMIVGAPEKSDLVNAINDLLLK